MKRLAVTTLCGLIVLAGNNQSFGSVVFDSLSSGNTCAPSGIAWQCNGPSFGRDFFIEDFFNAPPSNSALASAFTVPVGQSFYLDSIAYSVSLLHGSTPTTYRVDLKQSGVDGLPGSTVFFDQLISPAIPYTGYGAQPTPQSIDNIRATSNVQLLGGNTYWLTLSEPVPLADVKSQVGWLWNLNQPAVNGQVLIKTLDSSTGSIDQGTPWRSLSSQLPAFRIDGLLVPPPPVIYTPNIPIPTMAPSVLDMPSVTHPLLDVVSWLNSPATTQKLTAADRLRIQQQISDLQTQSSNYQPLSSGWKKFDDTASKELSYSLGYGTALAGVLTGIGVGGVTNAAERVYALASASNTLVGFLPNDNQNFQKANTAVGILDASFSASEYLAAGNVAGAWLAGDLFIWGTVIPNQLSTLASDPPTTRYKLSISVTIPTMPTVTGTGNASLDAFLTRFNDVTLRTSFFSQAVSASIDRYAAAMNAGDSISALLQLETILDYLKLLGVALRDADAVFAQLPAMLTLAGLSNTLADPSIFLQIQNEVRANGLPDDLISQLLRDGLSSIDVASFYDSLVGIDTSAFTGGPNLFDAANLAAVALDSIVGPAGSTSDIPNPPTIALTITALAALSIVRKTRLRRRTSPEQLL